MFESTIIGPVDDEDCVKPYDPTTGVSTSGYIPRDFSAMPRGSIAGTHPFPKELLLDWAVIKERIEEKEKKKQRWSDLLRITAPDAKWLNQSPTNYCWIYATTQLIMAIRALMGLKFKRLSPYSAGCIIDGGANRGGWGAQGLEFIIKNGIASEEFWPQGQLGSNNDSDNMKAIRNWRSFVEPSRADASTTKVTEWYDCEPGNLQQKLSLLVRLDDVPTFVSSGYNHEGHQTFSLDAIWTSQTGFGATDMDSYTRDGSMNLRNRSERRAAGDDNVAPMVVDAS